MRMHKFAVVLLGALLGLCACNSSGGGSNDVGSIGGGGTGTGTGTSPTGSNTAALYIDGNTSSGLNYVNGLFVTITVCQPGSSAHCAQIDHVLVDTGSYGLRLINTPTIQALGLTNTAAGTGVLSECVVFGDGTSFGTVSAVDLTVGSEKASSVATQIVGGNSFTRPESCTEQGAAEDTVADFGANGVLGVGVLRYDCGAACAEAPGLNSDNPGYYMSCTTTGACTALAQPESAQVQNPVVFFPIDNNGVAIVLAGLPSDGYASTGTGTIYFGIGTQGSGGNNTIPSTDSFLSTTTSQTVGESPGLIFTAYSGCSNNDCEAVVDTGSNAFFFPPDSSGNPPLCPDGSSFYCPSSTLSYNVSMVGYNGTAAAIPFTIGNATALVNTGAEAISELGGDLGANFFDWGLPFFYGRTVFYAIEGQDTNASIGAGPYIAF